MATMAATTGKKSRWIINKDLLPLKVFNFLMYGACMVIPYITIFLKQLGLTASEIGIIIGCSVFFCLFTRPTIGIMADKMGGRKMALVVCCIGFSSCFFSLRFIEGRHALASDYLNTGNGTSYLPSDVWICRLGPDHKMDNETDMKYHSIDSNITRFHENHQSTNCSIGPPSRGQKEFNNSYISIYCPSLIFQQHYQRGGSAPYSCFSLIVKNPLSMKISYYGIGLKEHNTAALFDNNNASDYTNNYDTDNTKSPIANRAQYFRDEISPQVPGCFQDRHQCATEVTQSVAVTTGNSFVIQFPDDSKSLKLPGTDDSSFTNNITFDDVFFLAFIINLIARAFYASTTSLSDAVIYSILGSNRHRWARQRLWGSLGTGISLIATTTLSAGFHQTHDLPVLLSVCVCLTFLACVVVMTKLNTSSVKKNSNLFRDLHSVLSNPAFRLHLCKLVLYGFMTGTAQNFFMWFIADIGGTSFNLALTVVVHCTSSIIMLRLTGRLLKRLGPRRAMYLVLVVCSLRFLAVSLVESPWTILPIELTHGITYSVLWAAASGSTSKMAAPGTLATCHSIAGAVYWDLGRGLGVLVTGQFIQEVGARWTFRAYCVICLAALPLFYGLDWLWPLPLFLSDDGEKDVQEEIEKNGEEGEGGGEGEEGGGEEEEEDEEYKEGIVTKTLLSTPKPGTVLETPATNSSDRGPERNPSARIMSESDTSSSDGPHMRNSLLKTEVPDV